MPSLGAFIRTRYHSTTKEQRIFSGSSLLAWTAFNCSSFSKIVLKTRRPQSISQWVRAGVHWSSLLEWELRILSSWISNSTLISLWQHFTSIKLLNLILMSFKFVFIYSTLNLNKNFKIVNSSFFFLVKNI